MQVENFHPVNQFEALLADAQQGKCSIDDVIEKLVGSELFIATTEEVVPRAAGIVPLLFDRAGTAMAAIFTAPMRANRYADQIKSIVRMEGGEILRNIPHGYGVVINPGFDVGLELLPEGIQNILMRSGR